jgi:hypothetical protein
VEFYEKEPGWLKIEDGDETVIVEAEIVEFKPKALVCGHCGRPLQNWALRYTAAGGAEIECRNNELASFVFRFLISD